MTIIRKDDIKYFLEKKAWMLLQLVLLPPTGHKESKDTLDYPIASKLDY